MPNRQAQEWIRRSMRTPGIFIFGLVLSPCGWILDLVATVAPNWRNLNNVVGRPTSDVIEQGIWDICISSTASTTRQCGQADAKYFNSTIDPKTNIIPVAQGLMVASLVVTLIGLAVAIPGVRCWKDRPNWIVAGLGGILIFLSGVMTIIPIAWYTNIMGNIPTVTAYSTIGVGYCIVLGYIGGIFEVLAGIVMFIGICRCCGGKNRGEVRVEEARPQFRHQKDLPRRMEVPRMSRQRSEASSVPYSRDSRDSIDEDVSFPRAKDRTPARTVTTTRPYDADL